MTRLTRRSTLLAAGVVALTPAAPAYAATRRGESTDPVAGLVDAIAPALRATEALALVPPVAARLYAAVLLAVHDAAGPAVGTRPLVTREVPRGTPDPARAARAAVERLLPALLVDASGTPLPLPDSVRASRPGRPDQRAEEWGRDVARAVGRTVAADRAVAALRRSPRYVPPEGPGLWRPTPPALGAALAPHWGGVRTWAPLTRLRLPGPPGYSPDPASPLGLEALAVRDQTLLNTPDDLACARFWADGPGTATPAGHWVALTGQLAVDQGVSLRRFVRICGDLGPVLHDAFVSCWAEKFRWNLLRPVTYLRDHVDPGFTPRLGTPAFPEYPSGHSVVSAAAARVLARHLDPGPFTDRTAAARGLTREMAGLTEAAEDASYSRLCGGIHFPSGLAAGLRLGRAVGR
jgi:PAP2 superfamily